MRMFEFDRTKDTPLVTSRIYGPKGSRLVQLVFDTGAAKTQFHTPVLESVGYSAGLGTRALSMSGASGSAQDGYALILQRINVLGQQFNAMEVGAFDFDNFCDEGIDGLLGFDIIREFHLEMNGPKGELIVYG